MNDSKGGPGSMFKLTDKRTLAAADGRHDDPAGRTRRAWGLVAEGYRRGLSELCPADEAFAAMQECLRQAQLLAGSPRLAVAGSQRRAVG